MSDVEAIDMYLSQTELSYEDIKQEIIKLLHKQRNGVLATSEGDNVTARTVLLFYDGLTIYCFTSNYTRKYKQIIANPNVAIVCGNIQIEGIAKLKGHPLDEENSNFIRLHQEQNPEYYKISENIIFKRSTPRVIEITPKRVARWITGGQIDILDVSKESAYRVGYYNLENSPAYSG